MAHPHTLHGKTGRAIGAAVCMVAAAMLVLPAQAQTAQLSDQVKLAQSDLDAAMAAHPSYRAVADGIASDCARKLPEDAKMDGFCRCAAAVTFSIWRSRVDDGDMLNRLNLYISNPTSAEVQDLLLYADVSIYKSACEKVLGKS